MGCGLFYPQWPLLVIRFCMLWHFKGTEREKVSSPDILPHLQVVEVLCYCFIDAVTRYKTPRWGTKDLLLITQSSMSMVSALSSVPQVPWRWHSGLQVNTESTLGFIHCWNHWFGEICCFLYWVLSLLCRDTLHPPLVACCQFNPEKWSR